MKYTTAMAVHYNEVAQINSIRWKIMFREDANNYTDQTGWFKCKDFLNDTCVYLQTGREFSVYGFNSKIKKNEGGVYILLKYIEDRDLFFKNLLAINQRMEQDLKCTLGAVPGVAADEVMLFVPYEAWKNTWMVSLWSYCVRLCNFAEAKFSDWESIWDTKSPAVRVDGAFTKETAHRARLMGFLVPKDFQKYVWYAGPDYNSVKNNDTTYMTVIHNCGCRSWDAQLPPVKVAVPA